MRKKEFEVPETFPNIFILRGHGPTFSKFWLSMYMGNYATGFPLLVAHFLYRLVALKMYDLILPISLKYTFVQAGPTQLLLQTASHRSRCNVPMRRLVVIWSFHCTWRITSSKVHLIVRLHGARPREYGIHAANLQWWRLFAGAPHTRTRAAVPCLRVLGESRCWRSLIHALALVDVALLVDCLIRSRDFARNRRRMAHVINKSYDFWSRHRFQTQGTFKGGRIKNFIALALLFVVMISAYTVIILCCIAIVRFMKWVSNNPWRGRKDAMTTWKMTQ